MIDWSDTDKEVLKKYCKPIVHMRRQFAAGRFALVFGTGLTQPLGMPGWQHLNTMLAQDPNVEAEDLLGTPPREAMEALLKNGSTADISAACRAGPEETIVTQRLYEHFRSRIYTATGPPADHGTVTLQADIQRRWRSIIREKLYMGQPDIDPAELAPQFLDGHPYLRSLLPLIRHSSLTVTYNFDDIIEVVLNGSRPTDERQRDRGYESTIDIRIPPRRRKAVVFHPNGYIPRNTMEGGYAGIVLSEDEFADRMIETMTGQYTSLLHHYTQRTCLFVGLSLKDSILKSLLRQCAAVTPGHYHYYVQHYPKGSPPSETEKIAATAANFETYNLRTLYLSDEEIAALGRLISEGCGPTGEVFEDEGFEELAESESKKVVYHYYVVGAVGVGKSTVVSHLRDLVTHDEWVEDRLPELAEDWHDLSANEKKREKRKRIDAWIAQQFHEKNYILSREKVGVVVSDRCPLDPLVFTPADEWQKKAAYLGKEICPGASQELVPGHVILLLDDPDALDLRVRRTNKKYRAPELAEMQKDLRHLYDMDGTTCVDCRFRTLKDIMKEVARIIHLVEPYKPADIQRRLQEVENGSYGLRPREERD